MSTAMDRPSYGPILFSHVFIFMMDGKTVLENDYSVEFKQVLPADSFCKTEKETQ